MEVEISSRSSRAWGSVEMEPKPTLMGACAEVDGILNLGVEASRALNCQVSPCGS
jgi:hypothetical protein